MKLFKVKRKIFPGRDERKEKMLLRHDLGDDIGTGIGWLGAFDDLQLARITRILAIIQGDGAVKAGDGIGRDDGRQAAASFPAFQRANRVTSDVGAGGKGLLQKLLQRLAGGEKPGVQTDDVRLDRGKLR